MRSAVAQALRSSGEDWEVCWEAENGQAAVDKAAEVKPDLVILDFIMPVRDGISAGREIRAMYPDTPIILFTLHASPSLEIQAKSSGFDAVVGKTEGTALIEAIRRVLQSSASVRVGEGEPAARILSDAQPGKRRYKSNPPQIHDHFTTGNR